MRIALLSLLVLLALAVIAPWSLGREQAEPILARAVPLHPADPRADRVGRLRFLGGWRLTGEDATFGGISSLAIIGERRFLAIGDAGGVFRFTLNEAGDISRSRIFALPDGPAPQAGGEPRKRDRDAEAMTRDPVTGELWIGFERANAIWRYSEDFDTQGHAEPPAMRGWPLNGGPEALVRLADGRFVVLAEEADAGDGVTEGLIFAGDPTVTSEPPLRFGYRPPEGYAATDAALLPDDRLLILNRRFTITEGPSAILSVADIADVRDDGLLVGTEIARLRRPLTVDNMEALAVSVEDGRTIVWISSDDNFNPLQRTLLLRFELKGE